MNRKIILPAMMLVLTSMLATVIEATAKMGQNNKAGLCTKWKLVPMASAAKAKISCDITDLEVNPGENGLKSHASILNLNALKTINGIVKELPEHHSTSYQSTR